jgi:hypothetical protein
MATDRMGKSTQSHDAQAGGTESEREFVNVHGCGGWLLMVGLITNHQQPTTGYGFGS